MGGLNEFKWKGVRKDLNGVLKHEPAEVPKKN